MSKKELIDFVEWYREDDMSGYTTEHVVDWYLSSINYLPNDEASRVNENEQTKEVCPKCGAELWLDREGHEICSDSDCSYVN